MAVFRISCKKGGSKYGNTVKGGADDFLGPGVCKGEIDHLCLATTPGKPEDNNGAVCNLVALLFSWSLQGVMDLFVPPALQLLLKKSMTLCHGRCIEGVMESYALAHDDF